MQVHYEQKYSTKGRTIRFLRGGGLEEFGKKYLTDSETRKEIFLRGTFEKNISCRNG